tara:strand:+ start:45 stop:965 length:921 start_codon:yes stop_codon:yes gene_type:complete
MGSILKMSQTIIFSGDSFTWGQGLWSYCPTNLNVPTVDDYLSGHPIPDVAEEFRKSNRFADLVARHFNCESVVKRYNGGTDEESIRFIDDVKNNYVSKYSLLTENVVWDNIQLCVFQTTQLYRSSFYFNYKEKDYRIYSEPDVKNFDRLEHIKIDKDGGHPRVLKETKDCDIFIDWLIDNNLTPERFEEIHSKSMLNMIKTKLKWLEEKHNIPTLILCWTDEYLKGILNDEWISKRLVKIGLDEMDYECIQYLFDKNPEMVVAHDPSVLHKSGIDGHPSLVCHKHIATSIINKIVTDKLINKESII